MAKLERITKATTNQCKTPNLTKTLFLARRLGRSKTKVQSDGIKTYIHACFLVPSRSALSWKNVHFLNFHFSDAHGQQNSEIQSAGRQPKVIYVSHVKKFLVPIVIILSYI